jgi:hypothetical protein
MLESLRTCAIGDGCGFVSRDSLDRAEQNILHGANAPAHQAAATAEANGQMVFLMPQQPVAGLPVSLYVNKARLQDVLKRSPNMCLQAGFNNWTTGLQKVRGWGRGGGVKLSRVPGLSGHQPSEVVWRGGGKRGGAGEGGKGEGMREGVQK